MAMALQLQQQAVTETSNKTWTLPSTLVPPAGTSRGLRLPFDRFAMRSSFAFSTLRLPSVNLATAPKFSMRVASKQAYICHDCGQALPFTIVAGIALLGGIYIYLSNTF